MTTIGKWRKPVFISLHTDCYSRKKYRRSLFSELEKFFEVDPKIKAARSSFIFYKAYTTSVDHKLTIYPCFAAITIIRRFPFADFSHFTFSSPMFSSKLPYQNNRERTQTLRPAVSSFRKTDNIRQRSEDCRSCVMSLSWTKFYFIWPSDYSISSFSIVWNFITIWLIRTLIVEMNIRTRTRKKKSSTLVYRYAKFQQSKISQITTDQKNLFNIVPLWNFQDELEKLNVAANSINHLEAELDVSVDILPFFYLQCSIAGFDWLIDFFVCLC